MKRLTLRNMRKSAPEEDLQSEALAAAPTPPHSRPSTSRYSVIILKPQTLEQLEVMCGRHGHAAVEQAKWGSVFVWSMKDGYDPTGDPRLDAALVIHRRRVRRETGFPSLNGLITAYDSQHTEAEEAEAEGIATRAMRAWENAGRPGLVRSFNWVFQFIKACEGEAQKHLTEPLIPHTERSVT